jgi:hypothetical protein
LELSNPVKAFPLSLHFAQRRSHWIRLPTYQPKILAIRKRIAIDGSAKGLIQFKSLIASIIQSEEFLSQSKQSIRSISEAESERWPGHCAESADPDRTQIA